MRSVWLLAFMAACATSRGAEVRSELTLERSYQVPWSVATPVPLFSVVRTAVAASYRIESQKPDAGALLTSAKPGPDGAVAYLVQLKQLSSVPVRRAGQLHAELQITVTIAVDGRETPLDLAPARVQSDAHAFLALVAQSVKDYEAPMWPAPVRGLP